MEFLEILENFGKFRMSVVFFRNDSRYYYKQALADKKVAEDLKLNLLRMLLKPNYVIQ